VKVRASPRVDPCRENDMTVRRTALLAAALALACAKNPVTGKRQLTLVSEEQEIALGKEGAQEVLQTMARHPDPKVQGYVESIGKAMAARSERPNLPWSFTVLDDPTVNAFALPGGPIFVTRGILTHMNSEAELAAVLGHEIGHITARHSVQQISKAQLAQVGLGVGMILSPELAAIGQLAGAGLQLMFLKFGRDAERQSDELGFKYMTAVAYDPREMANVFTTLSRASEQGGGGRLPEWQSTHPDPERRAETAASRAAGVANPEKLKTDREEYLALLQGMKFGEDPRQGFFQGNSFLHPDMAFKIDFPAGWQKLNTAAAVVAVSPKKDAVIQLALAGKDSPEEASKKFFAQKGVKAASLAGGGALPANARYFEAQTQQGQIGGLVSFFSHRGTTFGVVGYTAANAVATHAPAFQAAVTSFGPLTDPAALAVQPAKIELVKIPREMTVAEFHAQYPSTATLDTVALVNGVAKDGRLQAGRTAKRIVGGVLPAGAATKPQS
jgi:predicted Zn-dependent protease